MTDGQNNEINNNSRREKGETMESKLDKIERLIEIAMLIGFLYMGYQFILTISIITK